MAALHPSDTLHLTVAGSLEEIPRIAAEVEAFGSRAGLAQAVVDAVNLALDELVTNVIHYSGASAQGGIAVTLTMADSGLHVDLSDDGRAFDPFNRPEPDLTSGLDERPVGGLGIHFVRTMMDEATYRRSHGRNLIHLVKKL